MHTPSIISTWHKEERCPRLSKHIIFIDDQEIPTPFITIFFLLITDIQEFYELTLLDDTKTIQQKTVETLQIASKWEQENSLKILDVSV